MNTENESAEPAQSGANLLLTFKSIEDAGEATRERLIEFLCWELHDCAREWAQCDHGIARRLVEKFRSQGAGQ